MLQLNEEKFLSSLKTSFVSRSQASDATLMPTLLTNDYAHEKKILSDLTAELQTCDAFDFSVAFITNDGLASILQTLEYLSVHNIPGRILTTNYLNFTSPSALSKLLEFPNIEVRAYTKSGFHPKGYIFRQSNYYSMIIGSANLTQTALGNNQEWSVKFLSCTDGQIVFSVREEFNRIWAESEIVTAEWIRAYTIDWKKKRIKLLKLNKELQAENLIEANAENEIDSDEELEIVPNKMQKDAMQALDSLRSTGEVRALLIAATGTGKTYLSIFDVAQVKPKKVLYVAHRDMILSKSEKSFKNLLPNIKTGFLNGNQKNTDADFLFASIFTLSKDAVLNSFNKNQFDYIIIDEVHHAGAESYKKIIDYFTPKFLLGLTATPERTDGFDIFNLFHNNIPYEIRLQKALESDLLCPFHYYGISDLTVNNEAIDDKADFSKLVAKERISHIEKAIKLYKNNSVKVKGLIFCSRIEEAFELSKKLNADGFFTKCLTGNDNDSMRESVIQELESDTNPLQYIISVDIFNEGVDIPSVNQIVMLRPTQSSIIFVQQLGRGLRKCKNKSYVSVIDFIGNYENNFFIPIALYGDNSYNKDSLRKCLSSGSSSIPGCSTIQINEIARQKIFDSISKSSFSQLKLLKGEYSKLKNRLGKNKIPSMMDFVNNGFIDPLLFIDYAGSYYEFKCKIEKSLPELLPVNRTSLQFVSLEFAHGFRLHELLILKLLIRLEKISVKDFSLLLSKYSVPFFEKDISGILNTLSPSFYTKADKVKYGNITYIQFNPETQIFSKTQEFQKLLENQFYENELLDLLEYSIKRTTLKPNEIIVNDNLVLYRKYSRKDICKLLNWKSDCSSTIYGYKTETSYSEYTCPIFVTYKKNESISDTTKYDDVFIDNSRFSWMSRSRRTSKSDEVSQIINQNQNKIKVMLFVKKDDSEGSDFYYMGKMLYHSYEDTFMKAKDETVPVVNIQFNMETPVSKNLYNYLES